MCSSRRLETGCCPGLNFSPTVRPGNRAVLAEAALGRWGPAPTGVGCVAAQGDWRAGRCTEAVSRVRREALRLNGFR